MTPLDYWLRVMRAVLPFWLKLLGPKRLIALTGASTLLAIYLNYRY